MNPELVWYDTDGIPFERTNEDIDPLYEPSINWKQAGFFIEQQHINIWYNESKWYAAISGSTKEYTAGETPLIAALRAYLLHIV